MNHSIQSLVTCAAISVGILACGSSGSSEPATVPAATGTAPMAEPEQPTTNPQPEVVTPDATASALMDLMAVEMAAYSAARPVFEENCAMCHTPKPGKKVPDGAKHFAMASYPFEGHHATELATTIRTSLGASGKPATMPKDDPGSLQGEDLRLILAWADAFDAAATAKVGYHAGATSEHHHPKAKHEHPVKDADAKPKHEHEHPAKDATAKPKHKHPAKDATAKPKNGPKKHDH